MTRHENISGLFVKLFILLVLPCVVTSLTVQKLPRGFSPTWVSPRVKNGPLSPATHATISRYRRGLSDQDFGNRATDTTSSTQPSTQSSPETSPGATTTTSALPTTPATPSAGTTTTPSAGTTTTPALTTTTTSGTTTTPAATTVSTSTADTNTTATSQTTTTTSNATRKGPVPFMTIVSLLALILLSKLSSA